MERFQHGGDVAAHPAAVDFSASLNPLGIPQAAGRALRDGVDACACYPDPLCRELTAALARFEGLDPAWVLCCAGATDAFARICLALRPRRALVCSPCYSGYEQALEQVGAELLWHDLAAEGGFAASERLLDDIRPGTDLIFLANPNNPTGRSLPEGLLRACLQRARALGATLVLDECFVDLAEGVDSSTGLLGEFPNLIIVKALTKTFALAGLRVGYALCSNAAVLAALREAGQPWAVSVPAQLAGVASLAEKDYLPTSLSVIRTERARLARELSRCGLEPLPSEANFLLFRGPAGLYGQLLERGLLIRPCDNFRGLGDGWYRVAVRMPQENKLLISALREVLA